MSGGERDSLPAVEVVRLPHAVALPAYATPGAAGADLCAALPENQPMTLAPGARALVPTGLRLAIAPGYEAQVRPRSGLALRLGVTVLNAPGTIDSDYRGELGVILVNHGQAPATIQRGDRIAQLVIALAPQAVFREVDAIAETARGEGGFGSTGLGESLPPVQQQQQQDAGGRSGPKEE